MSHHELYLRSVMDDRLREARAARRNAVPRVRRGRRWPRTFSGTAAPEWA